MIGASFPRAHGLAHRRVARAVQVLCCCASLAVTACHGLLDVRDPTIIQDGDLANAPGANARRLDVIYVFSGTIGTAAQETALFSDELTWDIDRIPTYQPYDLEAYNLDSRDETLLTQYAGTRQIDAHLDGLDQIFSKSSVALTAMRLYGADTVKQEYLAQLFGLRGYLIVQMAEDVCPGFPINDISSDNLPVYSGPYTTDAAVAYGIAQLDSALAHGRDSSQFVNLSRVVKGRALLDLGQWAVADTTVASVPDGFTYATDPSAMSTLPFVWSQNGCCAVVGDSEGTNGLPFVSAHDPRVPVIYERQGQADTTDSLFGQNKYPTGDAPMVIASGVEARLIQAEAALHEPNPARMLSILNALRATVGLGDLSLPPTTAEQVNLLYHERAFWLYLTGRRLGDLRRLIKQYGRDAETVFPTGHHILSASYGRATAIPFTLAVQGVFNGHITAECAAP